MRVFEHLKYVVPPVLYAVACSYGQSGTFLVSGAGAGLADLCGHAALMQRALSLLLFLQSQHEQHEFYLFRCMQKCEKYIQIPCKMKVGNDEGVSRCSASVELVHL